MHWSGLCWGGSRWGFVCVCAQAQWCAVPGSAPRLPWIPVITHNSKFLMVADGSGPVKSLAASSTRVSQRNKVVVCQPVLIMWSCSCHLSSRVTHKPKQASLFTTLEPFNSFCLFNYHHSAQIRITSLHCRTLEWRQSCQNCSSLLNLTAKLYICHWSVPASRDSVWGPERKLVSTCIRYNQRTFILTHTDISAKCIFTKSQFYLPKQCAQVKQHSFFFCFNSSSACASVNTLILTSMKRMMFAQEWCVTESWTESKGSTLKKISRILSGQIYVPISKNIQRFISTCAVITCRFSFLSFFF